MPLEFSIVLVTLGSLFLVAVRSTAANRSHPFFWLTLLYLGCFVAALFVDEAFRLRGGLILATAQAGPLLGFGMAIAFSLLPSVFLRNRPSLLLPVRIVDQAAKLSAPFILFAFAYLAPYAVKATTIGAAQVRTDLNDLGITLLPVSPFTTVSVVVAHFYFLFALLYVVLTVRRRSRLLRLIMFLGSTLYILNALAFAARDGILWFLVAYAWSLWYSRPLLSEEAASRIRRMVLPVGIIGLLLFGLFSVQRFGGRKDGDMFDYALAYYGTQPYVFATTVQSQESFYKGRLRFPLFLELMGKESGVERTSVYEWSFGTFVKDFYAEGGWPFLIGSILLVTTCLSVGLIVSAGRFPEVHTLLSLIYVQFMAQGVFYFRLGNRVGNLYMVTILGLVLLMFAYRVVVHRVRMRGVGLGRGFL